MTAKIYAWLIFGLIGMAAFGYARKQQKPKILLLSILLMAYPYFVEQALYLWAVGIALTVALFVVRD